MNAVTAWIGERNVALAGAGEVGVDVEAKADVHDDQKRWPFVGNRFGVTLGLLVGGLHGPVPRRCAACGRAGELLCCPCLGCQGFGGFGRFAFAALFGFQHETTGFEQIDASVADRAVAVIELDGLFKDVIVRGRVGGGSVRMGNAQQITQLGQEELRIGHFGPARFLPLRNKRVSKIVFRHCAPAHRRYWKSKRRASN